MIELQEDIWKARTARDWLCITTCGTLRKDKALVMGRGIAKEAADRYPWLQKAAGEAIQRNGLQVEIFQQHRLILFPTKYQFYENSTLTLIENSAFQLTRKVDQLQLLLRPENDDVRILLPRPGCGNGKLEWGDVKSLLSRYFNDDRYVIFNYEQQS